MESEIRLVKKASNPHYVTEYADGSVTRIVS